MIFQQFKSMQGTMDIYFKDNPEQNPWQTVQIKLICMNLWRKKWTGVSAFLKDIILA